MTIDDDGDARVAGQVATGICDSGGHERRPQAIRDRRGLPLDWARALTT